MHVFHANVSGHMDYSISLLVTEQQVNDAVHGHLLHVILCVMVLPNGTIHLHCIYNYS